MRIRSNKILDRNLIKYLIFFCVVAFCITSISGILAKYEEIKFVEVPVKNLLSGILILYFAKFIYILTAIFLVRYLFLKEIIKGWSRLWLHLIAGVGLTFYSILAQIVLFNWLFNFEEPLTLENIYRNALDGADFNFFLYFSMTSIVYVYYFFKKQKDAQLKESNLKTQLLNAKVNSLHYQLQPHFLFNTLNDISSLIDLSKEKSQNAIADLSDLLRETLSLKDVLFIPLSKEIAILKKYLDIEKMRFDEKLNFTIDIDEKAISQNVPPLLLQPIVENSIKHGFSYKCDYLKIEIRVISLPKDLEIRITNNGELLDKDNVVWGTGINNVINRLDTLYNGDFEFELKNLPDESGVLTRIRFSLISSPNTKTV